MGAGHSGKEEVPAGSPGGSPGYCDKDTVGDGEAALPKKAHKNKETVTPQLSIFS